MIAVGSSYWTFAFGMNKGEAMFDEEGIQTMEHLGKNMAWILKSIEYSKGRIVAEKNVVTKLNSINGLNQLNF